METVRTNSVDNFNSPPVPTIGLFFSGFDAQYPSQILQGANDAAQELGVNLICIIGRELRSPIGYDAQGNILYDLLTPESVNALIIIAGSLMSYIGPDEMLKFCERYEPLPIVSIGASLPGMANVNIDNDAGMREIMRHLIEVHGYRRIAFIRGPEGNQEAIRRYEVYAEILAEHNIPLDPNLVTPGEFRFESGLESMRILLDERKAVFDAVVAANDSTAMGVLEALQARQIRVPDEMVVVGFDDIEDARSVVSPLTTVRQPLYEQGHHAVHMALAMLRKQQPPADVLLPTQLIVRQSCGCFSRATLEAVADEDVADTEPFELAFSRRRQLILDDMLRRVGGPGANISAPWLGRLMDGFVKDMSGQASSKLIGGFISTLDIILRQMLVERTDIEAWHGALSVFRRGSLPTIANNTKLLARAENLWQQARTLIAKTVENAEAYYRLKTRQQADVVSTISEALIAVTDSTELASVLARELPALDIQSAYLALYENPSLEWVRMILAFDGYGKQLHITKESEQLRFPARRLLPKSLLPADRRYTIIIQPLYFKEKQLGYVAMEMGDAEIHVYELLRRQISTALKTANLMGELEEEHNLLRILIDNIPDHIFAKDVNGRFILSNAAYAQAAHAASPEELVGKVAGDVFPPDLAAQYKTDDQRVFETGQPLLNLERATVDQLGYQKWVLTTQVPLRDRYGQVAGLVGISRDITERKRAEDELRRLNTRLEKRVSERTAELQRERTLLQTILDSMGEGVIYSENFRVRYANRMLTDLTGYQVSDLINQSLGILQSDKATPEEIRMFVEPPIEPGVAWRGLVQLKRKDGVDFDAALTMTMIAEDGKPLGSVAIVRDVTAERQLQAQKARFIANASHELRTPITNIKTRLYLLRKQPDQFPAHVAVLERVSDHMVNLIEDLLDISRFERGVISLEREDMILQNLISDVVQSQQPEASRKNISLTADLPAEPICIYADSHRMMQVMINLITNAINYTPTDGKVMVQLSRENNPEGSYAVIRVQDTGIGIAPEHLPRICEPFFRASEGSARGTGLGLSISKDIIDLHGGSLTIESTLGVGSTFSIRLSANRMMA